MTETTQRVEAVAAAAMRERRQNPHLGGHPLLDREREIPKTANPIFSSEIGYVQHIDTGALLAIATEGAGRIYVRDIPGNLVEPFEPIAFADGIAIDDLDERIRRGDLFDDLFTPIARDGASVVEIGIRLQKAFRTLSRFNRPGYAENARRHSAQALERAELALSIEDDRQRLRALASDLALSGTAVAG